MDKILVFIHTLPPLVVEFDHLSRQMLPGVTVKHILDEPLLELVKRQGGLSNAHAERLLAHVQTAAELEANAVLVTCSTISPLVDLVRGRIRMPVLKIDEAMIERAVTTSLKILVVATNPTTLPPTRRLLNEKATALGKKIQVTEVLVESALAALLAGDGDTHDRLVVEAIRQSAGGQETVLLAQASMARILPALPDDIPLPPVLSSPHLALQQCAKIFRAA